MFPLQSNNTDYWSVSVWPGGTGSGLQCYTVWLHFFLVPYHTRDNFLVPLRTHTHMQHSRHFQRVDWKARGQRWGRRWNKTYLSACFTSRQPFCFLVNFANRFLVRVKLFHLKARIIHNVLNMHKITLHQFGYQSDVLNTLVLKRLIP